MATTKEKKELLKKLKSDRKQICAQLDRFSEYASNCDNLTSKIIINERYLKCENLWDKFNIIQIEIENHEESESELRLVFEEKYFETICIFKELLKESTVVSNTVSSNNNVSNQSIVKLPPLDLPIFSGSYDCWLGFFDTFMALIHSNGSLTDVQKFYYLKSCLRGDAARVIHSIEVNELNYEVAFKLLKARYENKKFIIQSHVKSLFNLLAIAKVLIMDFEGKAHEVRALLDSGSQSNFITNELVSRLNLDAPEVDMTVVGITVLNKITSALPMLPIEVKNIRIPSNIVLADSSFNVPTEIDILLGADIFYDLLRNGRIKMAENMPTFQKTCFGWIISGSVPSIENPNDINLGIRNKQISNCQIMCHFSINERIDDQIEKFWKIEELQVAPMLKKEEIECEEFFRATCKHSSDGRFMAEYSKFMQEYRILGHMSEIPSHEIDCDESVYYMPHHGVIKDDSSTTRLRVVFDASAKTDTGVSLNDLLKAGPTIQDDLYSILIRFRKHNVVIGADAKKMYRQVWVDPAQRNLQRILWRDSPNEDIKHYRLNTVTYGTTPASFLAIRCLHEAAKEVENNYPRACFEITKNFYVDDYLSGGSTIEEVIKLKEEISKILERRNFKLRKWVSNKTEVFENNENKGIDQYIVDKDITKTLGLTWNIRQDNLQYVVTLDSPMKVIKRNVLSVLSRIFDPLGLVGPIIIIPKLIMQEIWKIKVDWDDELPKSVYDQWWEFYEDLPHLNNILISRQAIHPYSIKIEMHGFCDSSEKAYGACLFLRSVSSNGEMNAHILCAKSKVAPLKSITLPRLELCGALLLSRLITKTKNALNMDIDSVWCWSDSTIVLAWLASDPGKLNTFVSHRVAEIQGNKLINAWNHVSSNENPADIISRGCHVNSLMKSKLWWRGPEWLEQNDSFWPHSTHDFDSQDLPEFKGIKTVTFHSVVERYK
ncbi:uncharacterized protein LOC126742465 [Anthonomus grandis grandis]|uniref:uncharacterized protein LOC126742465 n=1 Tax=Anthonomus grandis grandis TaxID=2921223 RepID=UPI002165781D|nr:uncharacterized protein LOC126742465 [Anthonomus grandis grandis]